MLRLADPFRPKSVRCRLDYLLLIVSAMTLANGIQLCRLCVNRTGPRGGLRGHVQIVCF